MRRVFVIAGLAVVAAAGVATTPARAARASCSRLPVSIRLATADPTALIDQPKARVHATGAAKVTGLRLTLTRGGRTFASGARRTALTGRDATVALRIARNPGQGTYRLRATGRRAGCARRGTTTATLALSTPSLPVRVTPTSITATAVQLRARSVGGARVTNLTVTLLAPSGSALSTAAHPAAFRTRTSLTLGLRSPLASNRYELRVSGRVAGSSRVQTVAQTLAYMAPSGASGAQPSTGAATPALFGGVQHAVVDWSAGQYAGHDTSGFAIPGIGSGQIVCRPDAQYIQVIPDDASRETDMLAWTYRDWGQGTEKALRESMHTTNTGPTFLEGLNKFSPAEKTSTGEFDAIISDRGPIGAPGDGPFAAPTTYQLTWKWDFTQAGHESCHVQATIMSTPGAGVATPQVRSAQIVWRGDANATPARTDRGFDMPGVGHVDLDCRAGDDGPRLVRFSTATGATVVTRQGSDDAAVPQASGPISVPLPNNGMLAVTFASGQTALIASSWKVNDPDGTQNACRVSMQTIS